MKIFRLVTGSLLPLMLLLWLPSSNGGQGAVEFGKNFSIPIACGCTDKDKADLEQRIKRVEAAMKEYDALVQEWEQREKGAKEPLLLDKTSRKSVQDSVWFKMKNIKVANAVDYNAETDPSCKVMINPSASPCLRGALEDHEAVHKHECDRNKDKHLIDWRYTQRVVDYMKEEKAGYQKELERLKAELNKMPAFCSLSRSVQWALRSLAADKENKKKALDNVETFASTP
ncbi:MAG: hypothetical protein ACREIH_06235 [Nitrospiraceae bacterium]